MASIAAIFFLYGFGKTAKVNMLAYVTLSDYLRVAVGWIVPALGLPFLAGYFGSDLTMMMRSSNQGHSDDIEKLRNKYEHGRKNVKSFY